MRKQKNWLLWVGLGLLVLFIAFKMTRRENFIRSQMFSANIDSKTYAEMDNKIKNISKSLGYGEEEAAIAIDSIRRHEKLVKYYETETKVIPKDEFIKTVFGDISKFKDKEKKAIDVVYEYLYNQPEQTQPVTLVRLV